MIIDGRAISDAIKEEVKEEVTELRKKGIVPALAVVLVGDDPASKIYVGNKKKACEYTGIKSLIYELPEETTEAELLELVDTLNKSREVNGILVQVPLPKQIDEDKVINAIDPDKDVDCFHPVNVGRVWTGNPHFLPCTPAGIIELIKRSGFEIAGKNCVVIGRSNIVGKPTAAMLLQENGTVTMCHSKTKNLKEVCLGADIMVIATGKPKMLTGDMVREGAIVIDVGMNRNEQGKLCGDADFAAIVGHAAGISPVPGGAGLMTVAMLMKNCVKAVTKE